MSASPTATSERLSRVLGGTVVVTTVAFWRSSLDAFGYPKFAAMVLGIALAGALAIHASAVRGDLGVPWGPPAWAASAFAVSVLVVFLLRPTVLAFVGGHSRHTGALFYLALVASAFLMMRAAGAGDAPLWTATRNLALGVVTAGGLVALVGVLQMVGIDLLDRVGDPVVTSTFGNPNFAAALLGVTVPAAAWAVWDRAHGTALRVAGALTLAAALAAAVGTRSVQGPVTAAAGLLVFVLAVVLGIGDARRRKMALVAWAVLGVTGGVLGTASLLGRGPLGALAGAANVELRSFYWSAGLRMFADDPLTGVGLERYGAYFGEFRSEAAARRLDLAYTVDAAHNVPIQLFASGGLFVGLTYVAFVVLTGVAVVRAFRRTAGRPRLLVGALGGVWAAYQAQSFVSIETPPLALVHWLSAGGIVAWSGMAELRAVDLPWSTSRRAGAMGFRGRLAGALGAIALVALLALLLVPLRAGTAAGRGSALADAERYRDAIPELEQATARADWEPSHWQLLGNAALRADRPEESMDAYLQALEREPRSIIALVTAARIAAAQGDAQQATELYDRALDVEPLAPTLLEEAAAFFEEQGEPDRADELRQRAERIAG